MSDIKYKILVADDEEDIVKIIRFNLDQEGYITEEAGDGEKTIEIASTFKPDLILLDINMPIKNGMEVLKELRKNSLYDKTLILFLTALNDEQIEMEGFNLGADDYILKPIKPKVLISRIQSFLRRINNEEEKEIIRINDLIIDRWKYLVIYKGNEIILPRKEFELLKLLASKPGHIFTRQEISRKVWKTSEIIDDGTINVHIHKVRRKVGNVLSTIKGVGYRFNT